MKAALIEAAEFADVGSTGASTAVVGRMGEDRFLSCVNLGYCVCVVVRDGMVDART